MSFKDSTICGNRLKEWIGANMFLNVLLGVQGNVSPFPSPPARNVLPVV